MSPRSLIILFLFFFGVKLAISFDYTRNLFCRNPEIKSGKLTAFTGDSFSYTTAMENYITQGEYYFELGHKKITAGRVPHYSIPYYLLRLVFDKETALDIFVALQILLESIAFFLVSLLVFEITQNRLLFYLSLAFSLFSFFYLHYSLMPITDSPASSLLLISFWFLYRYLNSTEPKFKNWILFSLFIAMATVLRPYFGLIVAFIIAILFLRYKFSFTSIVKQGLVYGAILLILLTPWIIRNYSQSKKIMLFQQDAYAGYPINEELKLTRKMLSAIGEDASTMWDKTTAAGYFSLSMYKNSIWQVPTEISTDSTLNADFFAIRNMSTDSISDQTQTAAFTSSYHAFIDQYKTKYKFKYYFLNHLLRVKKFVINSGSYYYSYNDTDGCSTRIDYYLKVGQSLFYYLCLIPGFIGLLWFARIKKYGLIFLVPSITLVLFFPIYFGIVEWRHFLPFYYFHQIGLFYLFYRLLKLVKPSI